MWIGLALLVTLRNSHLEGLNIIFHFLAHCILTLSSYAPYYKSWHQLKVDADERTSLCTHYALTCKIFNPGRVDYLWAYITRQLIRSGFQQLTVNTSKMFFPCLLGTNTSFNCHQTYEPTDQGWISLPSASASKDGGDSQSLEPLKHLTDKWTKENPWQQWSQSITKE